MAAKKTKQEKAKTVKKDHITESRKFYENIGKKASEKPEGTGIGDGCEADTSAEAMMDYQDKLLATSPAPDHAGVAPAQEVGYLQPAALTLPLLTDNATLFLQGAAQLVADTLGKPECAPLLVRLNDWIDGLTKLKKLIVGNDDAVEGLKAKVIADGEPWGENGSRQLVLAGAQVRVKAVNWRPVDKALTIDDLDAGKVEAYLRGAAAEPEKTLPSYMRGTMTWGLKDLSPLQQKNLTAMLADPGEWGQGLRQCVKDTKWQMMAPEMINE